MEKLREQDAASTQARAHGRVEFSAAQKFAGIFRARHSPSDAEGQESLPFSIAADVYFVQDGKIGFAVSWLPLWGVMKTVFALISALTVCLAFLAAAPESKTPKPQYDNKGQLLRPADYREWMFLSSGFGMNYSPGPESHDIFTNVFVQRWAYQDFLSSGKWPEQTMFVIDERDAASRNSINKRGHYQTDLMGLAVEVKDSSHHPDKWAYYAFKADDSGAEAMPKGNGCFACHDTHAAVEHTFVQFYPTLKPVAKKFGTYNEAREQVEGAK